MAVRGQLEAGDPADFCSLFAAVDPAPDTEGSVELGVTVGEEITFWGFFIPDTRPELTVFHRPVRQRALRLLSSTDSLLSATLTNLKDVPK